MWLWGKKKSVTWFYNQCSCVTMWERKKKPQISPNRLSRGEDGWRVKRAEEGGLLPTSCRVRLPSRATIKRWQSGLWGGSPALLTCPLHGEQGTGSAELRGHALGLPGTLTVPGWLTGPRKPYSELRAIVDWEGKDVIIVKLERIYCYSLIGQWNCEILRRKEEWGVHSWGADLPERLGN